MQTNKLKVVQLYIWIILFLSKSAICTASNSNVNDIVIEDYSIANLDSKLEPIETVKQIEDYFQQNDLIGLSIIITAGATHEMIDSVSYISSKSSGEMSYAIAEAAAKRGARVTLISGSVHIDVPQGVTCF